MSSSHKKYDEKSADKKPSFQIQNLAKSNNTSNENKSKFISDSETAKLKKTREDEGEESKSESSTKDSRNSSFSSRFSYCPSTGSSSSIGSTSTPNKITLSSDGKNSTSSEFNKSGSTLSADSDSFICKTPDSSLYLTPENTPSTYSTQTEKTSKRPVKRSFNDQFRDETSYTSSSSFNNTPGFYTPDSSPSEYGSSVKRFKNRWSGSSSFYTSNDDERLNSSPRTSRPRVIDDGSIQPELIGYQMIGDSQFCRFGQQLLGLQRVSMPNCPGRIGICVSGQTITDLHRRVKEKFYPISDKIILMIGTNDFLRSVDVSTMCKELTALIKTLQETVKSIVLLTLPPIPKLEKKQKAYHFSMLNQYNSFIRSLDCGEKVKIADVSPMYMTTPPFQRCRMNLFELYFSGPNPRFDMIHLNRQGLDVIRKYILDNFLHN